MIEIASSRHSKLGEPPDRQNIPYAAWFSKAVAALEETPLDVLLLSLLSTPTVHFASSAGPSTSPESVYEPNISCRTSACLFDLPAWCSVQQQHFLEVVAIVSFDLGDG